MSLIGALVVAFLSDSEQLRDIKERQRIRVSQLEELVKKGSTLVVIADKRAIVLDRRASDGMLKIYPADLVKL